jgi:hypothetical protein
VDLHKLWCVYRETIATKIDHHIHWWLMRIANVPQWTWRIGYGNSGYWQSLLPSGKNVLGPWSYLPFRAIEVEDWFKPWPL